MRLWTRRLLALIALVGGIAPSALRAAGAPQAVPTSGTPAATNTTPPAAPTTAPPANELLTRAREVYSEQGPTAALPLFEQALAAYRAAGDRRGEAITIGLIGNCHKRLGDPVRALDLLRTALALKRELGDRLEEGKTLSHLGLVFWEQAEYPEAIRHFEAAIALGAELGDAKLEGSALNNLALVHDELGDYEQSLAQYRRALALYRRTDFPRGESDTLGNIGGVSLLLGRYRVALGYYRQALAISRRLDAEPSMSQDLGNIALCHAGLGEYDEAVADFDRALALARETGLAKEEADWLKGKGRLLVDLGRPSEGLELYRQALARYEASGLDRERVEALNELAVLHLELGDALAAEEHLQRALALARTIDHPRGVHAGLVALGELEWRRRRYEQAEALFREALAGALAAGDQNLAAACHIELSFTLRDQGRLEAARDEARQGLEVARAAEAKLQQAEAFFALGDSERLLGDAGAALADFVRGESLVEGLGEPEIAWRLAHGRGRALEALGREDEALTSYRRAVDRIETVRGRLREERFRAGYLEDRYEAYVDLARLLLRRGQAEEAFSAAERLRARSYLDLLSRDRVPQLSAAHTRRESELRQRIRRLQESLEGEGRAAAAERRQAVASYSAALADAEREYGELLAELRRADPALAATWSLAVPTAAAVRAALAPASALVELVVGEQEVLLFALTHERLTTRIVAIGRRELEAKVTLLRDLIGRPDSDAWRGPAASLAALLLTPLVEAGELAGTRNLLLVPHGVLHLLPFAALPGDGAGRPLVETHALTVLPSAGALVLGGSGRRAAGRVLALAPNRSRLAHASEEARAVVTASPPPSRLLLGAEATEGAFKELAAGYRVLHLATHSSWNRRNPLLSALELEPGGSEDGRLAVHEILDLRLGADLVTLSACETALGSDLLGAVPVGDDFVGLTRAFLHAGSAAVLASLWEVDDRSTLELMKGFYGELGRPTDPASALAAAQRRLLADPALAHPYHWAAFVAVGAARRGQP